MHTVPVTIQLRLMTRTMAARAARRRRVSLPHYLSSLIERHFRIDPPRGDRAGAPIEPGYTIPADCPSGENRMGPFFLSNRTASPEDNQPKTKACSRRS